MQYRGGYGNFERGGGGGKGVRYDIEGMSHYSLGVWGSASSSPIGVWGSAPEAITFYVIQTYKKSL